MSNCFHHIAMIDIGSNSVRLVIYRLMDETYQLFYNEKNSCRLGDLDESGVLKACNKQTALETLLRFAQIIKNMRAEVVRVVATAALRQAIDGHLFAEFLYQQTGLKVEIISGEQEGILAAKGVFMLDKPKTGLVGDLGGGSLELACLASLHQPPPKAYSMPLGILRLHNSSSEHTVSDKIISFLKENPFQDPVTHFYCVGGSWRALALVYFYDTGYQPALIQGSQIESSQLMIFLDKIIQHPSYLNKTKTPSVSKKRMASLPMASLLLKHLIEYLHIKYIHFSAGGIREGVLEEYFHHFHPAYQHTALTFLKSKNERMARFPHLAPILYQVLKSFFAKAEPRLIPLLELFCYSSDLMWQMAPDHRADSFFDMILYMDLPALSHQEKLFLAYAGACRYQSDFKIPDTIMASVTMARQWLFWAKAAGMACRYLYTLTGLNADLLSKVDMAWEDDGFHISPLHRMLPYGQNTLKRYENLCKHLGSDDGF